MDIQIGKTGRIRSFRKLLRELTQEDILAAAKEFDSLGGNIDSFEPSSTYDLVIEEHRYPPKAVFGLAASKHLNFHVKSSHFVGGEDSPCFEILRDLGFEIQQKTQRPGTREGLKLYGEYSREDVFKLMRNEGDTFKAGAGLWGMQGIIPNRPLRGDTVLFVTLDTYAGNEYEDAVTADGALIWKSQNQQTPSTPAIQQLISHDCEKNMVYLFLRSEARVPFTYLGPLAFREWDPLSSNPVHIVWNIQNWPVPDDVADRINLEMIAPLSPTYRPPQRAPVKELVESKPPKTKPSNKKGGQSQTATPDWEARDARNREIGQIGEELVLKHEKDALIGAGRPDLAQRIEYTAQVNSAAGYDIQSFDPETEAPKYIEVKTTTAGISAPFFISSNEVEKSEEHRDKFWIYRVYGVKPGSSASFYKLNGSVPTNFRLEPKLYKATYEH